MKDGEQLIPCEYDSISSWWEYGPSAHYVVKDKKVGIIDYIGKVLLPTEYDSLDYVFHDIRITTIIIFSNITDIILIHNNSSNK